MLATRDLFGSDTVHRLVALSSERTDLIVAVLRPTDGTIVWCSERGLRHIVDRNPEELVGRSPCAVMPPNDERYWQPALYEMRAGATVRLGREIERRDGRRIELLITAWQVGGRDEAIVAVAVRHPDERRGRVEPASTIAPRAGGWSSTRASQT